MYNSCKVSPFQVRALLDIIAILHRCGKDMAIQQNLQHWNNPRLKNAIILVLCLLRGNTVYLVFDDEEHAVATYQTKKENEVLRFQKLATDPAFAGCGVGSYCIRQIEEEAKEKGCTTVCMEVYDKSQHAIDFYEHRGYIVCGTVSTRKYTELKMLKQL